MSKAFIIKTETAVLDDLKNRLHNTRWTDEINGAEWNYGTNLQYLKELCRYWEHDFDWKKQEDFLNSFPHFKTTIEGLEIHYMHCKGKSSVTQPLLLTHGFPDSIVRFLKIIPLLTNADNNDLSFNLVIPSIPGYGFSEIPSTPGMGPGKIADIFHQLMTEHLGYKKYFAHGGDWGSSITEQLAVKNPSSVLGIHLTDIPFRHLFSIPEGELTESEKKYLEKGKAWSSTEGAYAMIQATKPQTLAYGLNDSPAALASWIVEKFYRWSDCNGNIETCFTKDELLTNVMIYWKTQTINSAMRLYYETMHSEQQEVPRTEVPAGAAIFPKDLVTAPKEYGSRIFNVQQWSEMPKGGHFAAMEQPELLANDIRKFVTKVMKI